MRNEAEPSESRARTPVADVIHDLLGQADAHLIQVTLGVVLVRVGAQREGHSVQERDEVHHEPHVEGVALESMDEDDRCTPRYRLAP